MRSQSAVARLAHSQHGVASRRQLLALGLSESAIGRMTRARRLHPLHRGVYAVGHRRISAHGRCFAAVLACGSGALLSHFAAAWLWGLWRAAPRRIDVTVPTRGHRRASIQVHHAPAVADEDRRSSRMEFRSRRSRGRCSTWRRWRLAAYRGRSSAPSSFAYSIYARWTECWSAAVATVAAGSSQARSLSTGSRPSPDPSSSADSSGSCANPAFRDLR